jgi:hypothetical protein
LELVFELGIGRLFANITLRPIFGSLQFILKRYNDMGQILYFSLLFSQFLSDFSLVEHLGSIDAGLHALHQGVVLILQRLNVALQLLSILEEVFMLLPRLHRVRRVLELLHHMVVLRLEARVLFIHHGYSFILVHVVVRD